MSTSGQDYAPASVPRPVVGPGEFVVAAAHLDHGHIHGMTQGLRDAGATVKWVYDRDPTKVEAFRQRFPEVKVARSEAEILDDAAVQLVAGAAITSERCALGLRVMEAGKDYFTDKAPLTTLEQLSAARSAVERTGRKYAVYYAERIHSEAAVLAGDLIRQGAIGSVVQVVGLGPHRVGGARPDWFFDKRRYGGILCDIGSHNFEQFLYYAGAADAEITSATVANYAHPGHPDFEDFGDAHIIMDNGATGYVRVDWFTPDGLRTWGDGRTFILGTDGFIELRKYLNLAEDARPDHLLLADNSGEHHIEASGRVGYPFFGELILDCLERTEHAMTQEHAFKAAELSVRAQARAIDLTGRARLGPHPKSA